jgi:hypothetical protein
VDYVVVLADDWDRHVDPVPYYSRDPDGCLDFNSAPAKPRFVLKLARRSSMQDCEHGVLYDVVICSVTNNG